MNNSPIFIKNIYYMLAYAFSALRQTQFERIAGENFENVYDLLAEILYISMNTQIQRGIHLEYKIENADLLAPRGHINFLGSIKNRTLRRQALNCDFDNLCENHLPNQIIKATFKLLLSHQDVNPQTRRRIRRLYSYMGNITTLSPRQIPWPAVARLRISQDYRALMTLCQFILHTILLSQEQGNDMAMAYSEERLHSLYEKFVLNFYRRECPWLSATSDSIPWNLTQSSPEFIARLPYMHTDITLHCGHKTLIIDTKYYSRAMQRRYEKETYLSNNLYQIFSYVKNMDTEHSGNIAGLLLYAKTNTSPAVDGDALMDGNRIGVRTLDLNTDFSIIKTTLIDIAEESLRQ